MPQPGAGSNLQPGFSLDQRNAHTSRTPSSPSVDPAGQVGSGGRLWAERLRLAVFSTLEPGDKPLG